MKSECIYYPLNGLHLSVMGVLCVMLDIREIDVKQLMTT